MALKPSVSGIRGTIGGTPGDNLTPHDIVAYTSAYATWLKSTATHAQPTVVIGRDARISGPHVSTMVTETLRAMGIHVVNTGLSTTPTVEMYVPHAGAQGGIIITASHNPREWNALKFLNADGEIISEGESNQIKDLAKAGRPEYVGPDHFGSYRLVTDAIDVHIQAILNLALVDPVAIRKSGFHVVVDCVNSTGALALPSLLDALGCNYTLLNDEMTGDFAHNPEPLEEHLGDLCRVVKESGAHFGIAVDPDVDRLALVDEHGNYFGEEYTLIAVADYILRHTPGPTVSNLSSSNALHDITLQFGQSYSSSKVGEVHVVSEMKRTGAVIGGEGNGGVIYPALHYGRDAVAGVALVLAFLAETQKSLSALGSRYTRYAMVKSKIDLPAGTDLQKLMERVAGAYEGAELNMIDGLKVMSDTGWVHLRASNTEPVIRIYAESLTEQDAEAMVRTAQLHLISLSAD